MITDSRRPGAASTGGTRLRKAIAAGAATALLAGGLLGQTSAHAAPASGPRTTPGTIFANEPLSAGQLPAAAASGQRYSYWTRGVDERLHLAVATIAEPKGTTPAGGWPVVVHAPAGNGLADACNTSADPQAGHRNTVSRLLRSGYAVISPDYGILGEGGSPQYADYTVTARNLLDAVVAGVVVDGTVSPRWALLGERQGAAAAIELARRATEWQPGNLDFRGAAATGIPAGMDVLISGLTPSSPAVSEAVMVDVVYALASFNAPELATVLSRSGLDLVGKAQTLCAPELAKAVRGMSLGQLVRTPVSTSSRLSALIDRSLELPRSRYQRPLLLSQPLQDDTVQLPEALRFLAEAQLASDKVQAASYLTGDADDARRQENVTVTRFLDALF